jgi:predicted amidophosphoribosyltransferase
VKNATKGVVNKLAAFLELLKHIWVLRLNKTIQDFFSDELDQCFALDFNFQDAESHTYTGIGQLEYAAKYQHDKGSIDKLAELLGIACKCHPNLDAVDVIASVPGNPSKHFHLPNDLVKRMGKHLERAVGLGLRKRKETPQLKTLSLAKKLETLGDVFELDDSVEGSSVLLVDDLYQSGSTMWSLAKFLKENGASRVYGLACVKSWRDSDNQ